MILLHALSEALASLQFLSLQAIFEETEKGLMVQPSPVQLQLFWVLGIWNQTKSNRGKLLQIGQKFHILNYLETGQL